MRPRSTTLLLPALLCIGALGLSACAVEQSSQAAPPGAAGGLDAESPVPTIGLGSDLGGLAAGDAGIRPIDPGNIESIVMIGDSITVGALPVLEEQFGELGFDDVSISAENGKRIGVNASDNPSGVRIARFIAGGLEGDPAKTLWIVALGANDIGQYSSVEEVEAVVDEVLDQIPDEAPVVWIDAYLADRLDSTREVNEAIENRVNERGNSLVGRWSEIAPIDGVLRSDGVHPNQNGSFYFAAVVMNTVTEFLT